MENSNLDKIIQTTDAKIIAKLNKDVQTLHHEIEPELFKPFNELEMSHYFEEMLSLIGVAGYVIFHGDAPAGYMLTSRKTSDETPFKFRTDTLHIDQICVESRFKGLGLGKKLVEHAKQIARDNKIPRVEMNFWTQNPNSGEFFSHEGFEVFNERMVFKL